MFKFHIGDIVVPRKHDGGGWYDLGVRLAEIYSFSSIENGVWFHLAILASENEAFNYHTIIAARQCWFRKIELQNV